MHPDLLTAFGMHAITAWALAWVMASMGRAYLHQGMSWGIASACLWGTAHGALVGYVLDGQGLWLLSAAMLVSVALGSFTVALQRFRQSTSMRRDALIMLLPTAAQTGLGAAVLIRATDQGLAALLVIPALQTLYGIALLARMRTSTPGLGWVQVVVALCLQTMVLSTAAVLLAQPGILQGLQATFTLWAMHLLWLVMAMVGCMGLLIMLRDRAQALEQGLALRDPLTQLPNRAALVQTLEAAIAHAAQQHQPLALMVLDIDHFKSVNDTHGHLVGDLVIQSIARTLEQQRRASDFAARYGGEEFVVVLPNTPARAAFSLAEQLCQAVRHTPLQLANGMRLHITISVGVFACTPAHGSDWKRLVAAADEAMYLAKRNGRDRVALSAPVQAIQSPAMGVA